MSPATNAANDFPLGRRSFLRVSATIAGGLIVSLHLDLPLHAQETGQATPVPKVYPPDAFVQVRPDGKIVIKVNRLEFGQGVQTSLPMILADEMDADWAQVIAELAPAAEVYKDPIYGFQMVGSSSSITHSFQQYREPGARTRAMLVAAAAQQWGVSPAECRTEASVVHGPGGQSARYAGLAEAAAEQPLPASVSLKDPSQFRLVGRRVRRLDSRSKCDGSLKFGLDFDIPGMQTAVVARPPVFGARVKRLDDEDARRIAGVRHVFEIPLARGTGVAVVADSFWAAKRARDGLKVDWDLSAVERPDSALLWAKYKTLASMPGKVAASRGDQKKIDTFAASDRIVAEYDFPYLAHTPMEPLNMTIRFDGDRAEAWAGSQFQTADQAAIADVLGLKPGNVTFHTVMAGGGFGRRATPDSHVAREAATIAKRFRGTPVKLVWPREDDVVDTQYDIPNFHVSAHHPTVNVPVLWWRSVGHAHSAFVMETLVDELATRAQADPIAYRRKLLKPDARRLRAALDLLEQKSAPWRTKLPSGHAAGIACHECFGTAVACAVDVSIENERPRVHRVTIAVDLGLAVNPLGVESQFQAGVAFGLTQLMARGAITLKDGRVEQRNFDGFTPPYMVDAPIAVDVHIVPSGGAPSGSGEPPVPVISPAVVNALARLTGKRCRSLPLVTV